MEHLTPQNSTEIETIFNISTRHVRLSEPTHFASIPIPFSHASIHTNSASTSIIYSTTSGTTRDSRDLPSPEQVDLTPYGHLHQDLPPPIYDSPRRQR
jgi:hypothetical protein